MFNVLNVRSTQQDLTTTARIRDAAIVVFGEQGFTAGVRAIATAAGVSPGLVIHHFGSKDGLREACDDYVLDEIRRAKTDFLRTPSVDRMFTELAAVEKYAPLVGYLVRSFQASGRVAAQLFDHMVADTAAYLEAGVAAGTGRAVSHREDAPPLGDQGDFDAETARAGQKFLGAIQRIKHPKALPLMMFVMLTFF